MDDIISTEAAQLLRILMNQVIQGNQQRDIAEAEERGRDRDRVRMQLVSNSLEE